MAEHADEPGRNAPEGSPETERPKRRRRSGINWSEVKDQAVAILAGVVRWVGLIFALLLVVHVIFTIAEANQDNGIVQFVQHWAGPLTLGFQDLFTPEDENLRTLVNYGIAAIFWLVVSAIGARIIRWVGGVPA